MTIYYKTNLSAGAPVLYGAAGSLVGVLDYCLVTTAGWTKTNTGTNLATYKSPSGRRFHLALDDTGTTGARLRGFNATTPTEAGVAESSGVGAFPTNVQLSGGVHIYKSGSADSTNARAWRFISNGTFFHLSINYGSGAGLFSFGDFISYQPGDSSNVLLMGESTASSIASGVTGQNVSTSTGTSGSYLARDYTGVTTSKQCGKLVYSGYGFSAGSVLGASGGAAYPSTIEGALLVSRVEICEGIATYSARGKIPGLWCPMQPKPLNDLDTFTGSGDLAGRTFVAWNVSTSGQVFIETSDTWGS